MSFYNFDMFKKVNNQIDFMGISARMDDSDTNFGVQYNADQVAQVIYLYWRSIPKNGKIKRTFKHQNILMDTFSINTYKVAREIATVMGVSHYDVLNVFRTILLGISEGKSWIKYIDPNLQKEMDSMKEKMDPSILADIKNEIIIAGVVVTGALGMYFLKK